MDEKNQEMLDKYIGKLLEIKDSKKSSFTEAELKEIALEIGMTEADLRMAREEVRGHLRRGQTYLDTQNWAEAEGEYQQAVELDPLSAKTYFELATFYHQYWQKTGNDKAKLDEVIRQCLAITPDYLPAKKLLKKITNTRKGKRIRRKAMLVFLGLVMPVVLVVGYFFLEEVGIISPSLTGLEGTEYQIPVEIISDPKGDGIELNISHFMIKHDAYPSNYPIFDYEYAGNITSTIYEVKKLRYQLEFFDEKGNVIGDENYLWLFNAESGNNKSHDRFDLHPKDKFLFFRGDDYQSGGVKVAKARLTMDEVERFRPPEAYQVYKEAPLRWMSQKVDYLDFTLRLRDDSFYADNSDYSPSHYLIMELEHTGTKACRELLLLIEWLDQRGQVVKKTEVPVVTLKHKPVAAGTKLIVSEEAIFNREDFPSNTRNYFSSYRISVKTAD